VIGERLQWCGVDSSAPTLPLPQWRRVDGFAVHAVMVGADIIPPVNCTVGDHRVDGRAVHPTGHVPVDPSSHHRTMQWCGVDGASLAG